MRTTPLIISATIGATVAVSLALGAQSTTIGTGAHTCTLRRGADCHAVVHRWRAEHHGDLRGINLMRADIRGGDLRGVDLRKGDLRGAVLRHADLTEARLRGADLRATRLEHLSLRGADARGVRFGAIPAPAKRGTAREMWDAGAGLAPECLPKCANQTMDTTAMWMDGSGADFTQSDWTGADAEQSNFAGANFMDATMEGTFAQSDFTNANLSHVYAAAGENVYYFAEIAGMAIPFKPGSFPDANMTGANMTWSDFRGGTFAGANLTNANLTGANIAGTDFSGATFHNTRCPNGAVTDTGC